MFFSGFQEVTVAAKDLRHGFSGCPKDLSASVTAASCAFPHLSSPLQRVFYRCPSSPQSHPASFLHLRHGSEWLLRTHPQPNCSHPHPGALLPQAVLVPLCSLAHPPIRTPGFLAGSPPLLPTCSRHHTDPFSPPPGSARSARYNGLLSSPFPLAFGRLSALLSSICFPKFSPPLAPVAHILLCAHTSPLSLGGS